MKRKNGIVSLVSALVGFLAPSLAMAVEAGAQGGSQAGGGTDLGPLAAGIAIGVAAFGGALGQAKTAASALDGIARNPNARDKVFVPMLLGLVLIESLVIYAFVIAFLVQ